jgi:hypothetical protein
MTGDVEFQPQGLNPRRVVEMVKGIRHLEGQNGRRVNEDTDVCVCERNQE